MFWISDICADVATLAPMWQENDTSNICLWPFMIHANLLDILNIYIYMAEELSV